MLFWPCYTALPTVMSSEVDLFQIKIYEKLKCMLLINTSDPHMLYKLLSALSACCSLSCSCVEYVADTADSFLSGIRNLPVEIKDELVPKLSTRMKFTNENISQVGPAGADWSENSQK